jgi:hypothetical protein
MSNNFYLTTEQVLGLVATATGLLERYSTEINAEKIGKFGGGDDWIFAEYFQQSQVMKVLEKDERQALMRIFRTLISESAYCYANLAERQEQVAV